MKKTLLVFLACVGIAFNLGEKDYQSDNTILMNDSNSSIYQRDYQYLYYTNSDNYTITNQNDIKEAIYNGLNNGQEKITLYCEYDDYNACIDDFHFVYDDKELMTSINNYISPYNKYSLTKYRININNGYAKIEINIDKKYSKEQIEKIEEQIDCYLSEDLDNMNTEQKIKWVHDFIINRNKYDEEALQIGEGDAYSAYGALVGEKAVCLGYAEAIAILLDQLNISNIMISNDQHIWNLVNVNGNWLHLDATWDDPITNNGKSIIKYDYYLITSSELVKLDNSSNHEYNYNYYLESLLN